MPDLDNLHLSISTAVEEINYPIPNFKPNQNRNKQMLICELLNILWNSIQFIYLEKS